MAVKIKLSRVGKRNDPKYRIVVMEGNKRRDGACIEKIGFYDPIPNPHILDIDTDKLKAWVKMEPNLQMELENSYLNLSNNNMEEFVTSLIKKIVTDPDKVEITRNEDDLQIRLDVTVGEDDFGKVIGKGGRTINSIRTIFNLYRHNHDGESAKRVYINLVENK